MMTVTVVPVTPNSLAKLVWVGPHPLFMPRLDVAMGSSGLLGLAATRPHPMPVVVGSVGTTETQYNCPPFSTAWVIDVTVMRVKFVSAGLKGTVQLSIGAPGELLLSLKIVSNIGEVPRP